MGYAVQLTKDEGLPTMVKRGAGFVRRRFFGKRARYLPGKKVLEAQAAEMVGKTAENCGLPTIISTNLTHEQVQRRYEDRIVSRLFATYTGLHFVGTDVRLQKAAAPYETEKA